MKIAVVTAVWRRPATTAAVLGYYRELKIPGVELSLFAAASEGEAYEGWQMVEATNEPLGAKWNAAFRAAAEGSPDGYVITGSDDLVGATLFHAAATGAYDWISCRGATLWDTASGRCLRIERFAPGSGRFFSRAWMRALGGEVFRGEATENIDGGPKRVTSRFPRHRVQVTARHAVVGIKDGANMWSYDEMVGRAAGEDCDIGAVLTGLPCSPQRRSAILALAARAR